MDRVLAPVTLSVAMLYSCTSADQIFFTAEAPDYNNEVVSNLLENVSSVRADGEGYAAFDWDNTCMFGDISYTSVLYQVENLYFRVRPENFETIFALGYNTTSSDACLANGTNSVLGQDANGSDVTLATVLAKTAEDYAVLFNSYIGPTHNLTKGYAVPPSLDSIKQTTEFINFRAKLSLLTFDLEAMDGGDDLSDCAMTIAMTVFPQLLVGMTEDEIKALIHSSIRWNLAESLETLTYTSTGELEVEGSYSKGLRFFNGQESTMRALRAAGVDVYVISASPQLFAAEAANLFGLGNMVTGELINNYPITWGPGKATIVTNILQPKHNDAAPIFATGDSTGDCEMLNTVRDGVVDTNNRLKSNSSCINGFYQKVCEYFGTTEPDTNNAYLLQGQDKVIGSWITSGFSTKDGENYKSAVDSDNACAQYLFLDTES